MEISAEKTLDGDEYLRVARTLRDNLDGLITSGAKDLGTQKKILPDVSQELDLVLANKATYRYNEISTRAHSCCEHEQVMNPALWSTLPMELLQRVFAKLPIPSICRLKSLSKEWQLSLQSSSSEFTLALKESDSPKILARITSGKYSSFWLHVLDGRNNRWHALHVYIALGLANRRLNQLSSEQWSGVHMNGTADAGLVCYVDKVFKTRLNCIYVVNPMTGVVNRLPSLNSLTSSELTMMRIVVDRATYHYKVIVVKHDSPVEAEVYDSEVQQWTKPKPSLGRIFGIAHYWSRNCHSNWSAHELGPCAYDCRDGKYYDFGQDQEKWLGKEVISYTLMKDRLFVLYYEQKNGEAFISEYCVPENATSWVKEETHSCFPWFLQQPGVPKLTGRIHAFSGFLYVFLLKDEDGWLSDLDLDPHKKHEHGWVYNLSTCEWRALPAIPQWSSIHSVMCELHWNIRP